MTKPIQKIPPGFHTVTPYLAIRGAAQAIEFYKKAFGAQERYRLPAPDGKSVGHAEIVIGDSIVMLSDEFPEFGAVSPLSLKGSPIRLCLYVEDVDAVFAQAVAAGATVVQPLENKFYGDRSGCLADPFGHQWSVMTHQEDVAPEEMDQRLKEAYAKMKAKPAAGT